MLGVDSGRPPRPTTELNVDAVSQFREFGCGDQDADNARYAGPEHGRFV